jgi:hypothetical protein
MDNRQQIFWLIALEGILCLVLLLIIPSDPNNAWMLGLSPFRLLIALGMVIAVLISLWLWINLRRGTPLGREIRVFMDGSTPHQILPRSVAFLLLAGILGAVFFLVAWVSLYPRYSAYFLRLSPLILFTALVCLQGFNALKVYHADLWNGIRRFNSQIRKLDQKYKIALFLIMAMFILVGIRYYQLVDYHARVVNQSPQFSDQGSYLEIAETAYKTDFQYKGDRNRTPLFSYLLAVFYHPEMTELDFFRRSQQVNIYLSLFLLVAVFFVTRKFIPTGQSVLLTIITAVSLFVYKAGYVQPELLFYFLNYISFILMGWMLVKPSLWLAAVTGLALALAYLAKASILPALALFLVMYIIQQFSIWNKDWVIKHDSSASSNAGQSLLRYRASSGVLMVLVFLALLSPYLIENKRLFGSYFYNVNTTFYAWYDSWEQVAEGTKSHGDDQGWPDMPPDQIPSMGKYLREHKLQQIYGRFISGFQSEFTILRKPYGLFNYPAIYSFILLVFCLYNIRMSLNLCRRYIFLLIFALAYFAGYMVSFAWFAPITNFFVGRFVYGLYLPYLFSLFVALNHIVKEIQYIHLGGRSIRAANLVWGVHAGVFLMVLYELYFYTPQRLVDRWYGK